MSVIRLGLAQSIELRPHGITALAITPGFLRSEAMLEHFGVSEANWKDGAGKDRYFAASESPSYLGRAVVALAADPDVARKSGGVFATWGLYKEYGFTDDDGTQPDFAAFLFHSMATALAGLFDDGPLAVTDPRPSAEAATGVVRPVFANLHLEHLLPLLTAAFYTEFATLGPVAEEATIEALLRRHLDFG